VTAETSKTGSTCVLEEFGGAAGGDEVDVEGAEAAGERRRLLRSVRLSRARSIFAMKPYCPIGWFGYTGRSPDEKGTYRS
jgi:hypothetical protein